MSTSSDPRSSLLGAKETDSQKDKALYHDSQQNPTSRLMQLAFVCIVILMVVITVILSIYRGATIGGTSALYFLLGISLLGFVAIEIFMMKFIRSGELPKEKAWFVYVVGVCIILQAIFTDVLLFQ